MACICLIVWLICANVFQSVFATRITTIQKKDKIRNKDLDLVLWYRAIVDKMLEKKDKCTHDYNFSGYKSLVFDYSAWDREMHIVHNVANFLTSAWQYKDKQSKSFVENEAIMYSLVRSNVLSSSNIFGSFVCFDAYRFKERQSFCPHAFRDKRARNMTRIIDLARYDYLNAANTSIWWKVGRRMGLEMQSKLQNKLEFFDVDLNKLVNGNASMLSKSIFYNVTSSYIPSVAGKWTTPYYDCLVGKAWIFTYLVPFYDETNRFLGLVSFDVELDSIEVNQCDLPLEQKFQKAKDDWKGGNIFTLYGAHHCKNQSTKCVHTPGGGFSAGNYRCYCRKGYYFPDTNAKPENKYFDGKIVMKTYGNRTKYDTMFDCLPCPEGCDECVDDTPCMYLRRIALRTIFLTLNEVIKALAVVLGLFIVFCREKKIIKASSPVFMGIIVVGIILMYFEISLGYLEASSGLCIARSLLYHTGFILAFGSLLLKTWRIVVIFRLRSAKTIELTDATLLKYLSLMVTAVLVYLMIWTWTSTQGTELKITDNRLKYRRCVRGWFSNAMEIGEILFLSWGVWLCLRVRNAPSAYNESKYIAWCIYNTIFIMVLVGLLRILLDNFHNPDVSYVVDFLSTHVVATVLLILLFASKIFLMRKYDKDVSKPTRSHPIPTTTMTEVRKSPFRLNRLADGTLVHELEDKSTQGLEAENIILREEVRSLNAQLAVFENKQARLNRRKGSEPEDHNRSLTNLHHNHSLLKPTTNYNGLVVGADASRRGGKTHSTDGSIISNGSVFTREEKGGSLIEDIKNAGNIDELLSASMVKSVSDEALTVISRVSAESQE